MDVKEATEKAIEYFKKFYPNIEKVQLEEVEITDDDKYWNIVLSYENMETTPLSYLQIGQQRTFKVFKIDADTGKVRSMKIKNIK
ncbi:MAG: hypothetical protein PVH48_09395 [Cyclobacteriaceae bacterium]|jgi:hypothetical protein